MTGSRPIWLCLGLVSSGRNAEASSLRGVGAVSNPYDKCKQVQKPAHEEGWGRSAIPETSTDRSKNNSTKRGGGGQLSLSQVQTSAEASPLRGVRAVSNL